MRGPAALLATLATLTPVVVPATGATGDPATVAYVRAIDANADAQRGMQVAQSGYMTLSSHGGATPSFTYRWGYGLVPRGSVPALEAITDAQRDGRVVWVADVLTPDAAGCATSPTCRSMVPIELMVTTHGAFAGVVTGPGGQVACFHRESFRDVPYRAGGRWWTAVGEYRPMVERGNQRLVTDTYAWADGQHVTELDSVDVATRLFAASSFHVGRGPSAGEVPFGFSQRDTPLTATPRAPTVTVCG